MGEEEVTKNDQEDNTVGKMVDMSAANFKGKVGKKINPEAGEGEHGKEADENEKGDFFTDFWANEVPRFHN